MIMFARFTVHYPIWIKDLYRMIDFLLIKELCKQLVFCWQNLKKMKGTVVCVRLNRHLGSINLKRFPLLMVFNVGDRAAV